MEPSSVRKWDLRYLRLAREVAGWSKDPSTKCGAVVVRPDRTIASLGYNGFPRGMHDSMDYLTRREEKYRRIIHAEMNAILSYEGSVRGCTAYTWPIPPCERCAVHLIQSGIVRVVSASDIERRKPDLQASVECGRRYLEEMKIDQTRYDCLEIDTGL